LPVAYMCRKVAGMQQPPPVDNRIQKLCWEIIAQVDQGKRRADL
jgi:hypothetical protein